MARMNIEFLHQYRRRHGLGARDRLIAYLPRYAPYAALIAPLMNLRNHVSFLASLGERAFGLSARRKLPQWSARPYRRASSGAGREVVLLVDTFNRYFEPENARAAERVLRGAGYRVVSADPVRGRPLCCGRTFLAAGLVDEARREAQRMLEALAPHVAAGTPIIGLEPSCLLTLRDEFPAILPGDATETLAGRALLFEEFIDSERAAGRFELPLASMEGRTVLLHGHCHQKAFAAVGAAVRALQLIPNITVETFDSTCCGMAGSFG
jgi:Fe-S oxidoreductase